MPISCLYQILDDIHGGYWISDWSKYQLPQQHYQPLISPLILTYGVVIRMVNRHFLELLDLLETLYLKASFLEDYVLWKELEDKIMQRGEG